jgi:hypothetical protein
MTFAGRYLEREARDAEVYKSTDAVVVRASIVRVGGRSLNDGVSLAPLMPAASTGDALHATL